MPRIPKAEKVNPEISVSKTRSYMNRGRSIPGFLVSPAGHINVPVSTTTRDSLHVLKESMGVGGQAEVIEKAIAIAMAIMVAAKG